MRKLIIKRISATDLLCPATKLHRECDSEFRELQHVVEAELGGNIDTTKGKS